jgi:hypothetical protein
MAEPSTPIIMPARPRSMPLVTYLGRTVALALVIVVLVVSRRFLPSLDVIGAAIVLAAIYLARPRHRRPTITPTVVASGRRVRVGRDVVISPIGVRERGRGRNSCPWARFAGVSVRPQHSDRRRRVYVPVVTTTDGADLVLGQAVSARRATEVTNAITSYRAAMQVMHQPGDAVRGS